MAAGFELPHPRRATRWVRVIDTATWAESAGCSWAGESAEIMESSRYSVHAYAIAVFRERAD